MTSKQLAAKALAILDGGDSATLTALRALLVAELEKPSTVTRAVRGAAQLLGDTRLASALYRLAPSLGHTYGRAGLLLKRESEYGSDYAKQRCVCGKPLGFDRLAIYSDGNSKSRLVHFECSRRLLADQHAEQYAAINRRPAKGAAKLGLG